ncbi:hypothetical protein F0562_012370 [Nyssa sinensis]|uniref:Uncharacterized protein n=1 Tax=Nyssa sinensis TaxID=561372 RepID=A0A5J4ZTD3_9ASTE|nr:hypothetical protein F0562_012370 [Nyssa sinensis]
MKYMDLKLEQDLKILRETLNFSLGFEMNSNAQNFAMGSNTGEHPEEMNAQTGAQNAQTGARRASQRSARTGSHPLLPSSIVNESIINGMQLHDYGFMGSWSTRGSFHINNPTNFYNSSGKSNGSTVGIPSKPIPNPQMGHSGMGHCQFTPTHRWISLVCLTSIKETLDRLFKRYMKILAEALWTILIWWCYNTTTHSMKISY